jgi:DNA-binding GntR family transcriptional regulator
MHREFEHHKQPLAGDRLFHLRIVEATGNGALVAVVKMLWEERMGPLYKRLEHHYDTPGLVDRGDGGASRGIESHRRARCGGRARRHAAPSQ